MLAVVSMCCIYIVTLTVNGEDGEYITVIFDTPEEAQQYVILYTVYPSSLNDGSCEIS